MIIESPFQPPKWLASCHLQTILPIFNKPTPTMRVRHERLDLPDDDFLDLSWADDSLPETSPLIILLHGIAGNVNSHYVKRFFNAIHKSGYRSVLVHFRGAGLSPNKKPFAYHSGATEDLNLVIQFLNQRYPNCPKGVIGFSMGGNILLKWLGETPHLKPIDLGIAVSVPFDLASCADTLNEGVSKLYQAYILKDLKYLTFRKLHQVGPVINVNENQLMSVNTIREYDNLITAPLYGFADADDYYRKTSCRYFLRGISNQVVILHAKDDPFMSPDSIPKQADLSKTTMLELSERGGHLGFIDGHDKMFPNFWLPQRIIYYLDNAFGRKGESFILP
jgi:predicted alpha/beta-fold hydrolase